MSSSNSIRCQVKWITEIVKKMTVLNPSCSIISEIDDQRWIPPETGTWKLNVDGSVKGNGREAGCGGVLRDSFGRFMFGFSHKLGNCSSLEAELWSAYHGLSLAWGKGFKKILVEMDSIAALQFVEGGSSNDDSIQLLINGIKDIGGDALDVGWSKVERSFNTCADILAKNYYEIRDTLVIPTLH